MDLEEVVRNLSGSVPEAVVESTLVRLRRDHPESDWRSAGGFCVLGGEVFLQFADCAYRRMWWVMVDSEESEVAMSWNLEGIEDFL